MEQMTGLSIISFIYQNLIENQELTNLVSNNIFPLAAEEGVKGNYIILQKTNINPVYNKDCSIDNISFRVTCYSINYKTTV